MMTQLVLALLALVCSAGRCKATIQLLVKDIFFTSGSSALWIPAMQPRERVDKVARQLLLSLWASVSW